MLIIGFQIDAESIGIERLVSDVIGMMKRG